jgi:hypothetical protein
MSERCAVETMLMLFRPLYYRVKVVLIHAMKVYVGNGGIASLILNLDTGWG